MLIKNVHLLYMLSDKSNKETIFSVFTHKPCNREFNACDTLKMFTSVFHLLWELIIIAAVLQVEKCPFLLGTRIQLLLGGGVLLFDCPPSDAPYIFNRIQIRTASRPVKHSHTIVPDAERGQSLVAAYVSLKSEDMQLHWWYSHMKSVMWVLMYPLYHRRWLLAQFLFHLGMENPKSIFLKTSWNMESSGHRTCFHCLCPFEILVARQLRWRFCVLFRDISAHIQEELGVKTCNAQPMSDSHLKSSWSHPTILIMKEITTAHKCGL